MKNSKKLSLGLLILSGAMVLASCGGGAPAETSSGTREDSGATTATTETTPVESGDTSATTGEATSGEELITPTKVKITQPGIVAVGSTLTIADFVAFTPANANNYWLESANEEVAKPSEDNKSLLIVGPGKTSVSIRVINASGKSQSLGKISITALSETAMAVQALADKVSNHFRVTGQWYEFDKTWENVTDADIVANKDFDFVALFVNPSYVLDWTYGLYSAIQLDADENIYGYNLLDENGEEVPGKDDDDAMTAIARATNVELTERVDANYLNSYFTMDEGDLMDLADWEEKLNDDGDTYFEMTDGTKAQTVVGNLFGMSITSYTGVAATVSLDEEKNVLNFEARFDYKGSKAQRVVLEVAVGEDTDIPLLKTAAKEMNPPAATDITEVKTSFAQFDEVFGAAWEIGLFDRTTMAPLPVKDSYKNNSVGYSLIDKGTIFNMRMDRADNGDVDEATADYSGIYTDTVNGGIYQLTADDDGLAVKSKETPITGSEAIKDYKQARAGLGLFDVGGVTDALLEGASLSLLDADTKTYSYNPTFDDLDLGAVFSTFCPLGYTDKTSGDNIFATPANAGYCECYITLAEKAVTIRLFERVKITEELSGYQGIVVTLFLDEQIGALNLGDKFADAFAMFEEEEPEPEPTESSEPEESSEGE